MLVQAFRRHVPDHDAVIERTLLRDPHVCVAIVQMRGFALDRGVLSGAVKFPRLACRPQLTIVVTGRGYLQSRDGVTTLRAGDIVLSHQHDHQAEGYGGSPCEVILMDWDDDGPFGGLRPTTTHVSRIGAHDLAHLRTLIAARRQLPAERWVVALGLQLRALGMPHTARACDLAPSRPDLVRLYAALGTMLSQFDVQPSLLDLATTLQTSERQVHRRLAELAREYGHAFACWRDFLHEMRLDWATQLLSLPAMPLARVAKLAGYRSTIALHHAFALRGAATPTAIARLLVDRWG